jgi:rhodanese-related sulfurtransferase
VGALGKILGGDKSKPVALICAQGVRSSRLSRTLRKGGYTNIIDVPEGMTGSYAGPGWIERGLPITR